MLILTHLAAGALVGKLTGNYWALAGAVAPDLDHVWVYWREGVRSPRAIWRTVMEPRDAFGDQRNLLHTVWLPFVFATFAAGSDWRIGIIITLGWLSHLILDAIDNTGIRPFFPWGGRLDGWVPYRSALEFVILLMLSLAWML